MLYSKSLYVVSIISITAPTSKIHGYVFTL